MSKVVSIGHFPRRMIQRGSSDALHPVGLSLANAMIWYWRVQQCQAVWTVAGTVSVPANDDGTPAASISLSGVSGGVTNAMFRQAGFHQQASDETQLVAPSYSSGIGQLATGGSVSVSPTSEYTPYSNMTVGFTMFYNPTDIFLGNLIAPGTPAPAAILFDPGTGLYYPLLYFSNLSLQAGDPNNSCYVGAGTTSDASQVNTIVTFAGQSFNIPCVVTGPYRSTGTASISGFSSVINLTPTTLWSYNGKFATGGG